MMHCPACGRSNIESDRYCESCGASLPQEGVPAPGVPSRAGRRWVLIILVVLVGCAALLGGWLMFLRPMDSGDYEQSAADVMIDSAVLLGIYFEEQDELETDSDTLSSSDIDDLQELTGRYAADMEEIRDTAHRLRPPRRYERTQERLERTVDFLADDFYGVFDRAARGAEPGDSYSDVGQGVKRELRGIAVRAGRTQSDLIEIAEELGIEDDIGEIIEIIAVLSALSSDSTGESDNDTY